jgi:hypothetical protein
MKFSIRELQFNFFDTLQFLDRLYNVDVGNVVDVSEGVYISKTSTTMLTFIKCKNSRTEPMSISKHRETP